MLSFGTPLTTTPFGKQTAQPAFGQPLQKPSIPSQFSHQPQPFGQSNTSSSPFAAPGMAAPTHSFATNTLAPTFGFPLQPTQHKSITATPAPTQSFATNTPAPTFGFPQLNSGTQPTMVHQPVNAPQLPKPSVPDATPQVAPPPLIIEGVCVSSTSDAAELAERRAQADFFVGAVLRDAYRFLCRPDNPSATLRDEAGMQHMGAALLGKASSPLAGAALLDDERP